MPVTKIGTKWSNGYLTFYDEDGYPIDRKGGEFTEEISAATKTLDAADSGKHLVVTADCTITLPATAVGIVYNIWNGGADASVAITLSPNSADAIMGCDISALANKNLVNTKTTALRGDMVKLVADGADGWFVADMRGTWTRET